MDGLIIDDNRQTADALQQMLEVLDLTTRVAYGSSAAMTVLGVWCRALCVWISTCLAWTEQKCWPTFAVSRA